MHLSSALGLDRVIKGAGALFLGSDHVVPVCVTLSTCSLNPVGTKRPHRRYLNPPCHQVGGKTVCLKTSESALMLLVTWEICRRFKSVNKSWSLAQNLNEWTNAQMYCCLHFSVGKILIKTSRALCSEKVEGGTGNLQVTGESLEQNVISFLTFSELVVGGCGLRWLACAQTCFLWLQCRKAHLVVTFTTKIATAMLHQPRVVYLRTCWTGCTLAVGVGSFLLWKLLYILAPPFIGADP